MCYFVVCIRYWGIITIPGFPRVNRPQIITRGWILTLHLNYVAGYTDPLLFLFERTQQLMPLTTRGKPWRLRVWAGPKFVRPDRRGPWVMKGFLGYWSPQELRNPPPPTTEQIKATCYPLLRGACVIAGKQKLLWAGPTIIKSLINSFIN